MTGLGCGLSRVEANLGTEPPQGRGGVSGAVGAGGIAQNSPTALSSGVQSALGSPRASAGPVTQCVASHLKGLKSVLPVTENRLGTRHWETHLETDGHPA